MNRFAAWIARYALCVTLTVLVLLTVCGLWLMCRMSEIGAKLAGGLCIAAAAAAAVHMLLAWRQDRKT